MLYPGDPELITLKGHKAIGGADVIIYAGSLVNLQVLANCGKAVIYNSAEMDLPEIIEVMKMLVRRDFLWLVCIRAILLSTVLSVSR